jgi:hypothetical protein
MELLVPSSAVAALGALGNPGNPTSQGNYDL